VAPGSSISPDQVARVVARLRRGWLGIFVTTGAFSKQAQVEVIDAALGVQGEAPQVWAMLRERALDGGESGGTGEGSGASFSARLDTNTYGTAGKFPFCLPPRLLSNTCSHKGAQAIEGRKERVSRWDAVAPLTATT
jgi:hypothetical protein